MNFSAKTRPCLFMHSGIEEAANFYVGLLPQSKIDNVVKPDVNGPALVVEFTLAGTPYMALAGNPDFKPDHSFSISVLTQDQAETDSLWATLAADGGEPGQCGWLKDKFGVHWQIVPQALPRLMAAGGESAGRVQSALMSMTKIDVAVLEAAARQELERISVATTVDAPMDDVWHRYISPADIKQWNAASDDWHTTASVVDLRVGGRFSSRMEAKDGSMGFDFEGTYTEVQECKRIAYVMGDRKAEVDFMDGPDSVTVRVTFDSEPTHSVEQQRAGWQAILDNFRRHTEASAS